MTKNHFFDPGVFFEKYHHIDAEKLKNFRGLLKQKYGLEEFFTKILTPFEICTPKEHSRNPFNDLIECNEDIITRILRQFLQGTSRSIQEIKWNVERCRRQLLNDMIGVAHRHSDLLQIQSNEEEEENSTPNSALLKGYIIFLEAKLPILLNVQRHMRSVLEEGRLLKEQERFWARMKKEKPVFNDTATLRRAVEIARFALSEVIYSWNALIDGLAESINSIDRAIEQARMDRILHEQEQIRAEQEATAENNRITERSGSSSSIDMDEETSASGANLLTVIGIFLAVIAILVEGIGGQYNSDGTGTPHPILHPVIDLYHTVSALSLIPMALVYVCAIGIVCLTSFIIQLFVHRIIQVMKNVWRQHFGQQIVYFYELDARIEELFKKEARQNLFTGNLDNWVKLYRDKKVEKQSSSKKLRFWNPGYWKKIYEEIPENYFSVHTGKYRWQKCTDWNIVNPIISLLYSYPVFGKAVFGQKKKKFIMWNLKRRYFRTERIQDDEALHKIQFEAEIILPLNKNRKEPLYGRLFIWALGIYTIYIWNYRPEHMEIWHILGMFFFIVCCFIMYLRWRHQRNKQLVPCYFTYEILFHKNPNVNNTFVLRELRFLAQGFQEELSWEESRQLKLCVIYSLIGAWIREGHSKQFFENLEREPITSFLEN